jgi:integrase
MTLSSVPLRSPDFFVKQVPKITTQAGLGRWSIHELRRFCASLLLGAVADQLGNASIHATKDIYVHLLPGSRAKTSKAMEDLFYKDYVQLTPPASIGSEEALARRMA